MHEGYSTESGGLAGFSSPPLQILLNESKSELPAVISGQGVRNSDYEDWGSGEMTFGVQRGGYLVQDVKGGMWIVRVGAT